MIRTADSPPFTPRPPPPTPDPTVAHIPVMWVLVLADRVENRWAGEEKRWGREYVHYVTKWQERDSSQM